jgi:hypothetical protein
MDVGLFDSPVGEPRGSLNARQRITSTSGSSRSKVKPMLPSRRFIAYLLFVFTLNAQAGLFFPDKRSWDENVLMSNGQEITVHRTRLVQFDAKPTIRFSFNGKKIKWNVDGEWPNIEMPDILDVVNGIPVVLVTVQKWWGCYKYGFPKEQLVAFGYKDGRWDRIDVAELPKSLKVNLIRSLREDDRKALYRDKPIPVSEKVGLEGPFIHPAQGEYLSKVIEDYRDSEEACWRMRPPEPAVAQVLQRGAVVERNAPTLAAEVSAVSNTPEKITKESERRERGLWNIGPSCSGIVERARDIHLWTVDEKTHQGHLIGYELNIRTSAGEKKTIQMSASIDARLETLVCDQRTIVAVRREHKGALIIYRLNRGGDLIDVYRITLPDAPGYRYGSEWPWLWTVVQEVKDELLITLADHKDPVKSGDDATIEQKVTYKVKLPPT